MIKEIKYGGFTASPSDYESPDGELAALIGLVPDEGNLKPIMPPNELFKLEGGKVIRFVHETSAFRHYIILDPATNIVSWTDDGTASTQLYNFTKSRTIHNINAIGNTIVILADNGMHYFLWKSVSEGYLYLGTHMPECPISFGLQGTMERTDVFSISFDSIGSGSLWDDFSDSNKTRITSQVLAKVNKFIAEKSTNNGRFIFPFLVRYAYRLYDGSLTMHSAPVLMVASSDLAPQVFYEHITGKGSYTDAQLRIVGMLQQLDYEFPSSTHLERLKNWKDIIRSVDIFVSKPIYTYDQNGECTKFVQVDQSDCYCICKHINQAASTTTYPLRYQKHKFSKLYAFTYNPSTKTYPTGRLMLPQRSLDDIKEDIRSCSQFYFLESLNVENLSLGRKIVPIEDDYLQSLVTREVMTDDYDSHDTLLPQSSYNYNSRLNLHNIKKVLFDGYNGHSLFCHTDGKVENYSDASPTILDRTVGIRTFVFIKQDGKDIIVESEHGVYGLDTPTLFFYYPNPNAYKALIETSDYLQDYIEIPLEPHSMLNGAFYFGGWESPTTAGNGAYESSLDVRTIDLPNKIYTSEVNNPFYFPVLGINTVGTGTILGISTAAKALSQGQFGQFPLYAFTTEGVWALEVSSTGGYSAKQPITRDVCINADSITQLDSAVLFATDRGIMLISGSNSQCISDTLDYSQVFSIDSLPQADKLVTMAGFKAEDFAYVPFRDYLLGCRMIYAYTQQRVIVYNPAHSYAYVYSLKTKTWGMMQSTVADNVPSYPEALAMLKDGTLVDFCTDAAQQQDEDGHLQGIKGLLITRPLKLDAPDLLKTIDTAIQRGNFRNGSIKSALYGSRDLQNWSLIWTSQDHYLRGFRGTPYKYFRFALLCDMQPDESLFGATIQYTPRLLNQPR